MDDAPEVGESIALIRRVRTGDRHALDELLRLHHPRLLDMAQAELGERLRGQVRPSDIVQSTWLDAVQCLQDFRGDNQQAFASWIHRILMNNVRDRARFHSRDRRDAGREISGLDLVMLARENGTTPSAEYAGVEELERLSQAMTRLSTNHRRVLVMRLVDQLSHEQIGERMDLSVVASRQLLARARASLMIELSRKGS